jgi:spore coat protein CotH
MKGKLLLIGTLFFIAIANGRTEVMNEFIAKTNSIHTLEPSANFTIGRREALFKSMKAIDQTNAGILSDNESYCNIPGGDSGWIGEHLTTPIASNLSDTNQLIFSDQEGFYTNPFLLSIYSVLGDTIYYTLNGDIPTDSSIVFNGSLFISCVNAQPNTISEIPTSPEQNLISYKAWEPPSEIIDKATIIRCASYKKGIRTSKIYTKTYFVDNEIKNKYTLPVISLVTAEENLFNSDSGIFVPGVNYNITNPEWTGNYFMTGDNWERDIHIEYFEHNGTTGFSQDAGIRIHGGKTRQAAQKSLRLYAREECGTKYFNYKLFPQKEVYEYKRFILRTTMAAWGGQTIIKDALAQNIASSLNIDYQDFQPVIVFVNGEYWGIHTIRDRIDEKFIEYMHNIDEDSVEFNELGNVAYNNLIEFIEDNSLEFNSNYEYVKTQIDIDNYIDYTIAELFFANYDWPANNMKMWRKIPDGKWRWVFYDLDAGFGNPIYNMFKHATLNDPSVTWPNSPSSTFLFRNLLKNDAFKAKLIHRYAEILNSVFDYEIITYKLDSIKAIYSPEIERHIGRWNYPDSFNKWEQDIENELLSFIEKRPCEVRKNIMTFFNLTSFGYECCTHQVFETNELILAPNPNSGNFFLLSNSDIKNASITITGIDGHVVYKENNVDIMKNERKYMDLSDLSSNVYVLQILSNNDYKRKTLVIAN